MYEKIFGLSCIENHVLAILKQRDEKIEYAYYNCAVPIRELYTNLVSHGIKQEYFDLLERIQDVLKNLDIIELVKKKVIRFDEVKRAICECKENEYILVRVLPHFTQTSLLARGFREDHFVYAKVRGKDFEIFNDIPERVILLTASQFKECFDGEYFYLSVKRKFNNEDMIQLWDARKFRPEEFSKQNILINSFDFNESIGTRLRNLVGVYKILRYRMIDYYGQYVDTEFIREAMPQIEKIYAMFEYYNLKSRIPMDKYSNLFCKLYDMDVALMMELNKEMEDLINDKNKD